ncbi:CYTH domain-containing protein [Nonlabens xiamenensis]|uniref:CYTH domain-containing protein n=1 Tax=Nonlabens xiamenensis TaxID=2341043 RepID=UPI000F6110A2|nr:CYTH domain-containing protein [Nonlabens xiamenensis]
MIEIERKFLLKDPGILRDLEGSRVIQGYLSSDPDRAVRIRIIGDQGLLTIKGASSEDGLSRYEWERNIGVKDAQELLKLSLPGGIDKTRYKIKVDAHTWEVDAFHGPNEGLFLAEIELNSTTEKFVRPDWLGEEVTGQRRFYNAYINSKPYCTWENL